MKLVLFLFFSIMISSQAGQQSSPVEWVSAPELGESMFYMVQRTPEAELLLTPNEAFFPKLGLNAGGEGEFPLEKPELNQNKNFKWISGWDPGDAAEWGLWVEKPGSLKVSVAMDGAEGSYLLSLSGEEKKLSGKVVSFNVRKPGMHVLRITCRADADAAKLHALKLSGSAVENAGLLRKRWRPSAAHARFSSSANPKDVRLVIIEMDAKPGTLGFYAPITTPFGYYGPTWKADGLVNTGFNFSLWSYGRGKEEPPVERLSHLIAIGDPTAEFSGFGHEGTGVKIRGWEPLEGRQGQRQAFAIRMEPGEPYTTYATYFYAADEARWKLFGVGRTFNKRKPKTTLGVGTFVEVPGAAERQRTGPYERCMRYRGWVVDGSGRLHPFDQLSDGDIDKATGMTQTARGVNDEGWFYLQTGGWVFEKKAAKQNVVLPRENRKGVDYLKSTDLRFLQTVPSEISGTGIAGSKVSFNIRNLGKNPEVKIYWGSREGLTFSERWENQMDVKNPCEGRNTVELPGKPDLVRLFLKNDEGQFFSKETLKRGE